MALHSLVLALALAALAVDGQDCSGMITTSAEYTAELENILAGGSRTKSVCERTLMTRINIETPGSTPSPSLSANGVFWVFASDYTNLNTYLGFAEDCVALSSGACLGDARKSLVRRIMNYAGFGNDYLDDNWDGKEFNMVVFDEKAAYNAWGDINGPFQPIWMDLYAYLTQDGGFQVCNNVGCAPDRKTLETTGEVFLELETQSYQEVTGCADGYSPRTVNGFDCAECGNDDYCSMITYFKGSFCSECGSTKCVDLYNNAAEAGFEKNTKFTRAFFELCWASNPWFTGKGFGFNPEADVDGDGIPDGEVTGTEFLVRGDIGVPTSSLTPSYSNLWPGPV